MHTSRDCPYPGLMVEIIKLIANEMNAQIQVYTLDVKDNEYSTGIVETNRTTGLLGYVSDGSIDTIAYPLQHTAQRDIIFDFTEPLYHVESTILHRRHDNRLNFLWAFFTIYDSISYSMMGAVLILQVLFYIANQYCQEAYQTTTFNEITNSLWEAMQLHLGQTIQISRRNYAVKFNVMITHFFHYVILLGVYSSWLFSQKVIVNKTVRLDGFPELIRELERGNRYFVSTTGADWFYETLRDSQVYPYKNIRETLKNNPVVITRSKIKTLELASEGRGVALIMEDDEANFMSKSFCNLVSMSEPVSVKTAHLVFKKGSKFVEPMNEAIRKNNVKILSIFRKYIDYMQRLESPNCDDGKFKVNNHVVLPYYGLIIGWSGMISVAAMCFFAECLFSFLTKQWRKIKWKKNSATLKSSSL